MEKNLFAISKELKILNCSTQTIKGCFLQIFKTVTEDREQREREQYVERVDTTDTKNTLHREKETEVC